MKSPGAYVFSAACVSIWTLIRSNCISTGWQLNHRKEVLERVQSKKVSDTNKRHTDEDELLQVKFDKKKDAIESNLNPDDPNYSTATKEMTDTNLEYYSEKNSLQSKHDRENQEILQQNKSKESLIDMDIEQNNTQLQVATANLESFEKIRDNNLKGSGMD